MPQWASSLLIGTEEDFKEQFQAAFEKDSHFAEDPYLEWMKRAQISFDPLELYQHWTPCLKQLFSPVLQVVHDAL